MECKALLWDVTRSGGKAELHLGEEHPFFLTHPFFFLTIFECEK